MNILWSAMVGNPYRYRAALMQQENRHATAGCLLALLFVIPFAAKTYNMATLLAVAVIYSAVVVPIATGFVSLSAVTSRLRLLLMAVLDTNMMLCVLQQTWFCALWLHEIYSHLDSIHTTTNQVLFFLLCEKVFCAEQRLSCLYVLLFYTVLAYLWRSLYTRQWTQLLHENSTANFIKLTTAFIVVRLGKGVAMSLVLLTFSLQFNHLEPSYAYVLVTGLYFLLTQYQGEAGEETKIVEFTQYFGLHLMEAMEEYWVPFLIRTASVLISAIVVSVAAFDIALLPLCLLSGYTNVYVAGLQTLECYWKPLETQHAVISLFPLASHGKLAEREDVTCAICLDDMRYLTARVTPCNHMFHSACLRKCVLQFGQCPLCKTPL